MNGFNQPTPQMQPTNSPPQTPIHPVEENRNWLKWVLIVTGIAILSSTATYFVVQSQSKKQAPPPQVTQAIPTPTPDPTANWKTYANKIYNYSLKYPDTLQIREGTGSDHVYIEPIEKTGIDQFQYSYYLSYYVNPNKLPIKDVVTHDISDELKKYIQFTKGALGNYTVYTTDTMPSQSGSLCKFITADESRYVALCFSPYNSKLLTKEQGTIQEQNELKDTIKFFNQILSTFKFTE